MWNINPKEVYEQKEFLDVFYQCLSEVPARLADAFVSREIDGLSTKEICKVLNESKPALSLSHVYSHSFDDL